MTKIVKAKLIKYPLEYNAILEYWNAIESGEIVASKKLKRVYKELVRKINDPNCQYVFDAEKANRAMEFIENFCKNSKPKRGENPQIKLQLWQKALVSAIFGMVDKESRLRMVRELILIIARKNGELLPL